MFPTELICICYGVCLSLYELGYLVGILIPYFWSYTILPIGSFLLVGAVSELFACFWLWDVHNRELPDYLIDCIKFER